MKTATQSWIASANDASCDFPLQNLPYGVFRHRDETHIGIAIGDLILDLHACAESGLFSSLTVEARDACRADRLNPLMSLGPAAWTSLRHRVTALLADDSPEQSSIEPNLVPMREAVMQLPAHIGDYTDFYASIHHATRIGQLFRPESPLLPNYKHLPIGYHGRSSSIVVSGESIRRPSGQIKSNQAASPIFGPTHALDYELEVGIFVGPGNLLGHSIPIAEAEQHVFGLCLLNDWSARDIQSWEYQPLGPFLAKNFATTISPWIVTLEALAPYRAAAPARPDQDPAPLPYLSPPSTACHGMDITLEVYLSSSEMRQTGHEPVRMSRANMRDLYWTVPQLLAHHTCNGCNLRPGDLIGTGTISGPETGSEGCMLEMKSNPSPITLPTGEARTFLEDGDQVVFRAYAQSSGLPRIGFGECRGTIAS
ncbi:MAG: fumarylacetoacetase [Acidobacteria bacterium]|nr:fumarylacetoacetase [Acidobacteriota bacterium]